MARKKGTGKDDILNGTDGRDQIYGMGGNDTLSPGATGPDLLDGGKGDDFITVYYPNGGWWMDSRGATIIGGAGLDVLEIEFWEQRVDGIETRNIAMRSVYAKFEISGIERFHLDFGFWSESQDVSITGTARSEHYLSNIQGNGDGNLTVKCGGGNDWFEGSSAFSSIMVYGGAGHDILQGSNVYGQRLYGGDGNDILLSLRNSDSSVFDAGAGNDLIYLGNAGSNFVVDGGPGQDTVVVTPQDDRQVTIRSFEHGKDKLHLADLIAETKDAEKTIFENYLEFVQTDNDVEIVYWMPITSEIKVRWGSIIVLNARADEFGIDDFKFGKFEDSYPDFYDSSKIEDLWM